MALKRSLMQRGPLAPLSTASPARPAGRWFAIVGSAQPLGWRLVGEVLRIEAAEMLRHAGQAVPE